MAPSVIGRWSNRALDVPRNAVGWWSLGRPSSMSCFPWRQRGRVSVSLPDEDVEFPDARACSTGSVSFTGRFTTARPPDCGRQGLGVDLTMEQGTRWGTATEP